MFFRQATRSANRPQNIRGACRHGLGDQPHPRHRPQVLQHDSTLYSFKLAPAFGAALGIRQVGQRSNRPRPPVEQIQLVNRYCAPWTHPSRFYRSEGTSGVEFKFHDLREECRLPYGGDGVSRFIIARILNHVDSAVTAVYDRHGYDPDKKWALLQWDRRLHEIVSGEPAAKVVSLL